MPLRFNADLLEDAELRRTLVWFSVQAGALAAMVVIGALVAVWRIPPRPAAVEPNSPAILGAMTQVRDVVWDAPPPRAGSSLSAGRLALRSGLVQIELISGATVVVQGPAVLDLKSPMLAVLERGRARAHVPPPAEGVMLAAPAVNIVDRGTEFGVQVDPTGSADVHVFDGKIELHHADRATQTLTTGRSVHVDPAGRVEPIDHGDLNFVGPAELAGLVERDDRARYEHWLLATVYDADAGFVSHYVDGRRVSRERIAHPTPLRIGPAEIGNWAGIDGQPRANDLRNLNGRIDGFVLFSRPLGENEVRRLYDAGRP